MAHIKLANLALNNIVLYLNLRFVSSIEGYLQALVGGEINVSLTKLAKVVFCISFTLLFSVFYAVLC